MLFALFAVALAVRLLNLGAQSLWNDEMFTLKMVALPLRDFFPALYADTNIGHPPLYFLIAWPVVQVFGTGEFALRIVPAVFGACTVPALYRFVHRAGHRITALAAAALLLFSPFHLTYSQEARPYALAILLALLSVDTLAALRHAPRRSRWILLTLFNLCGLYTHYWFLLVIVAQGVIVLSSSTLRVKLQTFLVSLGTALLLFAPQAGEFIRQASLIVEDNWWWADPPSLLNVAKTLLAFSGVYFAQASADFHLPSVPTVTGAGIAGIGAIAAVILSARPTTPIVRVAGLAFAVPLAVAFLISLVRPEFYVWYRYPVIVLPFFLAFVAFGLAEIRPRWLSAALTLLLLSVSIYGCIRYEEWEKANPRSVAAYVRGFNLDSGDLIIRPWYFADLFNYYYHEPVPQAEEADGIAILQPKIDSAATVVLVTLDMPNALRTWMDTHYRKLAERHFPGEKHMGIVVGRYDPARQLHPPPQGDRATAPAE